MSAVYEQEVVLQPQVETERIRPVPPLDPSIGVVLDLKNEFDLPDLPIDQMQPMSTRLHELARGAADEMIHIKRVGKHALAHASVETALRDMHKRRDPRLREDAIHKKRLEAERNHYQTIARSFLSTFVDVQLVSKIVGRMNKGEYGEHAVEAAEDTLTAQGIVVVRIDRAQKSRSAALAAAAAQRRH